MISNCFPYLFDFSAEIAAAAVPDLDFWGHKLCKELPHKPFKSINIYI